MDIQLLFWCSLAFVLGYGIASFYHFTQEPDGKIHMAVEHNKKWVAFKRITYMLAIVMVLGTAVQLFTFTYDQRECNAEVVATLKYRGDLAESDAQLNDQRAAALKELFDTFVMSTQSSSQEEATAVNIAAFNKYQQKITDLNAEKAANARLREERPYPECNS